MEFKDIFAQLRENARLSQSDVAERLFVTRQAVSRWECGETMPNTATLAQISKLFNVSINTLLGSPRQLCCQSCGMPLSDDILSHELDGTPNEDYCQWCYSDGAFVTDCTMEEMLETCVGIMSGQGMPEAAAREHMTAILPKLSRWQRG
ncbi:MAG: helix-turn-helix domain-containing protein [Oscillospiraceae bacterium]|jgi:transcriptional regulator with XRE-family HTH domain|nr:helix-turn-helix domain-containing protein [Oscillospiraceae bacterium]